jgi:hypothetical protein
MVFTEAIPGDHQHQQRRCEHEPGSSEYAASKGPSTPSPAARRRGGLTHCHAQVYRHGHDEAVRNKAGDVIEKKSFR